MTAQSMARHTSLRAVSDSNFQTAVIPVRGLMVRDGAIRLLTMRVGLRAAPDALVLRGREAMPPVSRTRCSVLHGAPQSRKPKAMRSTMDPGSAAHRRSRATRDSESAALHPGNA